MSLGLFTTLRVTDGAAWFWDDHLARLRRGAAALGLPAPEADRLAADVARAVDWRDARVRITLRKEGADVEAGPYEAPGAPWRLGPVAASPDEDTVRLKTTARGEYDRARAAAGAACDDALLVGKDGGYLETTVANVFFLTAGGRLLTPPASAPLLAGIVRRLVLANAPFPASEARIDAGTAAAARACVVTNALLVAHPVAVIEGVGRYSSAGLARFLREAVALGEPKKRIIR